MSNQDCSDFDYCAKHCTEMVTIDSEEENSFFHEFMRNVGMKHPGAWLGARIDKKREIRSWYNGKKVKYQPKTPAEYSEPGVTVAWQPNKDWWRKYF